MTNVYNRFKGVGIISYKVAYQVFSSCRLAAEEFGNRLVDADWQHTREGDSKLKLEQSS